MVFHDDFDSSDIEFDSPPPKLNPREGQRSIELIRKHARADRITSQKVVDDLDRRFGPSGDQADGLPSSDDVALSSSSAGAIDSDDPIQSSSPPASPPGFPWEQENSLSITSKAPQDIKKNAFSILGKRRPLADVTENARPTKKSRGISSSAKQASPAPALAQMQLSLGQAIQIKCQICGMSYIASSDEDQKLHKKYHKQNTQGFDVGKDFVSKVPPVTRDHPTSMYPGVDDTGVVSVVDCYHAKPRKRRAQAVLEIAQREMGAVEIPESELWGYTDDRDTGLSDPKWWVYLYVKGNRAVGLLLAQAIDEAYKVKDPSERLTRTTNSSNTTAGPATTALASLKARQKAMEEHNERISKQPLMLSRTAHPVKLGIARIWTSPTRRGNNIATRLLDVATEHWNNIIRHAEEENEKRRIEWKATPEEMVDWVRLSGPHRTKIESKDEVAFSQPTEAGRRLATKWYGKAWGWGVYVD